jgi:hypothetical protein
MHLLDRRTPPEASTNTVNPKIEWPVILFVNNPLEGHYISEGHTISGHSIFQPIFENIHKQKKIFLHNNIKTKIDQANTNKRKTART